MSMIENVILKFVNWEKKNKERKKKKNKMSKK